MLDLGKALLSLVSMLPSTLTLHIDTGLVVLALVALAIWRWRS
jgi:hypothetical protein